MAQVPFLSDAWLELQRTLGAALPQRPGATARVQHVISGTPQGEVRYVVTTEDGRTTACTRGADDTTDVTLTLTHADAVAVQRGELDATELFMQGRMKMAGDMGKVLALMPVVRSAEHRDLLARSCEQTAY